MRIATLTVALLLTVLAATPAPAATRDTAKPRVAFTTADSSVLLAGPASTEYTEVRGTATDIRGRGIRKVTVRFCGNATVDAAGGYSCGSTGPVLTDVITTRAAAVGCTSKTRQRCVWQTAAPANPGTYLVTATAEDLAGNRRSAGPIFIVVI